MCLALKDPVTAGSKQEPRAFLLPLWTTAWAPGTPRYIGRTTREAPSRSRTDYQGDGPTRMYQLFELRDCGATQDGLSRFMGRCTTTGDVMLGSLGRGLRGMNSHLWQGSQHAQVPNKQRFSPDTTPQLSMDEVAL